MKFSWVYPEKIKLDNAHARYTNVKFHRERSVQSQIFANALVNAWKAESKKASFSEVQQFRALMKSFSSLPAPFKVEEFHGMKHQVIFNGKGSWGRASARCEISDLLIISYSNNYGFKARATLLQAKKSNEKHNLCSNNPLNLSLNTSFKANLEQWDLLSRRPNVLPYPPFHCHPEILSGAILQSIGSIGVFHKIKGKEYDFFYMSADIANPISSPKQKHAKLQVATNSTHRIRGNFNECIFSCCLYTFALALFNLEVGTPIDSQNVLNEKDEAYRNIFRSWLKSVLYSHLEMTNNNSQLARELIEYLPSEQASEFMETPPALLIINCSAEEN